MGHSPSNRAPDLKQLHGKLGRHHFNSRSGTGWIPSISFHGAFTMRNGLVGRPIVIRLSFQIEDVAYSITTWHHVSVSSFLLVFHMSCHRRPPKKVSFRTRSFRPRTSLRAHRPEAPSKRAKALPALHQRRSDRGSGGDVVPNGGTVVGRVQAKGDVGESWESGESMAFCFL